MFIRLLLIFTIITSNLNTTICQDVNTLKLKDYKPNSIYKIPQTTITKAKYPVIDVHSHDYPASDSLVDQWVRTMDEAGIEKTIILSGSTGKNFDSIIEKYGRYKKQVRCMVRC